MCTQFEIKNIYMYKILRQIKIINKWYATDSLKEIFICYKLFAIFQVIVT